MNVSEWAANLGVVQSLQRKKQTSFKVLTCFFIYFQLNEFTNDILLDDVQSLINPTSNKPENVLTWL